MKPKRYYKINGRIFEIFSTTISTVSKIVLSNGFTRLIGFKKKGDAAEFAKSVKKGAGDKKI